MVVVNTMPGLALVTIGREDMGHELIISDVTDVGYVGSDVARAHNKHRDVLRISEKIKIQLLRGDIHDII